MFVSKHVVLLEKEFLLRDSGSKVEIEEFKMLNQTQINYLNLRLMIGTFHIFFYTINHLSIICFYGVFNSSNA